jgi:hypothetical protein
MGEVIRTIVNTQTGEVTIQPLTEEEIVELQARADALEAEEAEAYAILEAEEASKESARAKLSALGLTEAEVAALVK